VERGLEQRDLTACTGMEEETLVVDRTRAGVNRLAPSQDLGAIYDYLRTLRPIRNQVAEFEPG
jgi:hypothetical protein